MLILGDSHVGRMFPYRRWLGQHTTDISVRWIWQGGAGINWAEQQVGRCAGFRLVILMIGGNDLDVGWCSPYQLADRIGFLADQILQEGAETVVIPSLWPRSNVNYNTRARQYAGIMERRFSFDPQVTFWLWDRRQAWRNVDGVHFLHHGYRQAIRYLIAFIVWVINHNLW